MTAKQSPPATSAAPSECPSCGRFVGPNERCPYCGADVGQRLAIRAFRYGSLVLALAGLAVLLFAASRSQAPTVEIGSLVGTMNWAYVRIEGLVVRQPTYDAEAQSLKVWVWDGSGEILVTAYRAEAKALLAEGRAPAMGDSVAVEGTLRIREDFQYLVLNVPEHTEVRRAEPVALTIAEAHAAPLYQAVTVRGVVRDDRIPYEGLRLLTLRDAGGEIDVTLPTSATVLGGALPEVRLGQSVQVSGAVDQYKGTPQISVGRGDDVVVLDEALAIAPARRSGELAAADVGSLVQVEGTVAQVSPFSAGVKFSLDDGSGPLTLLLWQDLYDALPNRDTLGEGATVRAVGLVSEYRGEMELVPELPADVAVLGMAERIVAERQVSELTVADVGQVVLVEGVLQSLRSFSAGVKGVLDDGTGAITLLLWQDVYDGLADPGSLAPGAQLRVEGEVAEYKGELELVPQAAADVTVVGRVELPSEERAIGQLSADDVGQTVQVAGQIAQATPFSAGYKYTLDDGTGRITLLLWQDLYEQLADAVSLVEGARVSARGRIDEYEGELEVVPQAPADVVVTQAGAVAQVTPTPTPSAEATPEPTETLEPTAAPSETPKPAATQTPTPQPTQTPTPAVETRSIGQISNADVGQTFTLAKVGIAEVSHFSAGCKYTLTDASGQITLLLWQNVLEETTSRYDLFSGSQVRITGEIDEYQGELEIVPASGADVVVLNRGDRPPVEQRSVSQITPSDEGRIFVVEGTASRVEAGRWLNLWLNDGTGEILVYVPERVVEYLPAGIGPGVKLRVTGEVDIYKGQLEIIPLAGADVEVR